MSFDTDKDVVLTTGSKAAVRYLNLVGDRYLELLDGPGSTQLLPRGAQIPLERTQPALDLDLLLGGLKPVIRGLEPRDVNALTDALLQIFQGQGDTHAVAAEQDFVVLEHHRPTTTRRWSNSSTISIPCLPPWAMRASDFPAPSTGSSS